VQDTHDETIDTLSHDTTQISRSRTPYHTHKTKRHKQQAARARAPRGAWEQASVKLKLKGHI
jgi:hypothetical protein